MSKVNLPKNADDWLEAIKEGDEIVIKELYILYKTDFVIWLQNHSSCVEEEAVDVFQDSIIALVQNCKSGKIVHLSSSLKTYIYAIGWKIYLNHVRQNKVKISGEAVEGLKIVENLYLDKVELEERQQIMLKALQELGPVCQKILHLFYYEGLSLKEIAKKMNYKNADVVKSQKSRCLQKLTTMMKKEFYKGDL